MKATTEKAFGANLQSVFSNPCEKWQTKKLGDVSEVITRGISPKYIELGGVCVLNQRCIRDHLIDYSFARIHDVSTKQVNHEKFIQVGDILVNSTGTGTLGRIAQVKEFFKATVDSHVTIIRPKKNLFFDPFFGYALMYLEETIQNCGTGACGQIELPRVVLQNELTVSFPTSLTEQHRIVSILDKAFTEIDKAKKNTEENIKKNKELFEAKLQSVFSNPSGNWQLKKLGEVCETSSGGTPLKAHKDYYENGLIPWLLSGEVSQGNILKATNFITEKGLKNSSAKLFPSNTVLIAMYGATAGQVGILRFEATTNQAICGILPNEKFLSEFLYYCFISKKKELVAQAVGGAQPNISQIKIKNTIIPFPSLQDQYRIITELDSISTETKKLEKLYRSKLTHLEELKKSILKQAFEGKL